MLDDSRAAAVPAPVHGAQFGEFADRSRDGPTEPLKGKGRRGGDAAADDAQGLGEGDPVGVAVLGGGGGLVHQCASGVMDDQVRPDLLTCAIGTAGTQDGGWSALVGLQLLEDALDLPPLQVQVR